MKVTNFGSTDKHYMSVDLILDLLMLWVYVRVLPIRHIKCPIIYVCCFCSKVTSTLCFLQEIHAPMLGLWGVRFAVIAVFFGFTFASIVSRL